MAKVWLLAALLVPPILWSIFAIGDWSPYLAGRELPWWPLVIGFYLAEMMVVHLRFRQDAHSFSMSEIPLVIGLFYMEPVGIVAAGLIANTVVLTVHRRQPTVKLAFNVVQFALQSLIAIAVFRLAVGESGPLSPAAWLAALVAAVAALVAASLLINVAIRFMGGSMRLRDMGEVMVFEAFGTLVNVSMAIVAVALLDVARSVAALGFVAPLVLYLAYRAYVGQRQERSRLKALYDATRALHASPQIDAALLAAARHAQQMVDGEFAEIVLFPVGPEGPAHHTLVGPDQQQVSMEALDLGAWDGLWQRAAASREGAVVVFEEPLEIGAGDHARAVTDCLVAPILSGTDVVGMLIVGNHISDVAQFEPDDLDAVTTLSGHVGVSLENGRLVDSMAELTILKEQLRHQALHDSVTGLANRVLFLERLSQALARAQRHAAPIGVLYLDLDDFKSVNDEFGHAAGDRLLEKVAGRLRHLSRAEDTVARLSGDEFALIAEDGVAERELVVIASRIIDGMADPFVIEGHELSVTASIGVAVAGPGEDPDHLMRRADAAMYTAKRAGKSRYAVAAPGFEPPASGGSAA